MLEATRDLRYACRQLLRSPGFAAVVILTLALGISAATSIFSFANGVLLRPLPFPEPDRIVMVCETHAERPADWCGASPANWADWSRTSRTLQTLGLAREWPFGMRREGRSRGVRGGIATPGLFQVFRAQPVLGRLFAPEDIQAGREQVLIVSHAFWQTWLGGKPDALGQTVELDGQAYRVVGVLPAGFEVPQVERVDVWIPLWPERLTMRGWRGFRSFARLQPGASLEQARAEMAALREQLAGEYPETNAGWGVVVDSLHDRTVRSVRPALLMFLAAVFLVLLIACANVANLFLARGASREREFAVRLALGASRGRLVRQLLIESLLYALGGGALGVLLATWAVALFSALAPAWLPRLEEVRMDGVVLAFALGVSVLSSVLFGLVPALKASDLNVSETLREGRSGEGTHRGRRTRDLLVVAEVAMACVLLVGAGLLLRSFANLLDWKPGFDRNNLVLVQVFASPGKYPEIQPVVNLFRQSVEELRALPGVVSAGAGSAGPLFGGDGEQEFYIEGRPLPAPDEKPVAAWYDVDPNYFQALGIRLVKGRLFTTADTRDTPLVAVINEAFARRFFPGADPAGQRVHMTAHKATFEIVGVVGDVQPFRPDRAPQPEIYWPFAQMPRWAIYFIVRTATPPATMAAAIRGRLEQLDPDMEIGRIRTLEDQVSSQLVNPQFNLSIVGLFAGLALAIAMVGVYSVLSFSIVRRAHEFGVRMALGAGRMDIFRLVVRRGFTLAVAGLAAGLLAAWGLTRLLTRLLVNVAPSDPATFLGVGAVVVVVAFLASYVPARRATRVDPIVALRHE
jgi:putative ABC transport system permease protein